MTSKDAMGAMAIERPPGITSLFEAAAHGHNHVCNVMGVVGETWDAKEPQLPYARDWQTKFYIRDQSEQVKGLSVKYFAPLQSGLPKVAPGDIILLRDLKIIPYRMEWGGLSNRDTNFVVFPRNSICDPGFRHQYAVHDRMLPHVKNSSMTLAPTMHEQQWAISLKSLVSIDNLASKGTIATTESNRQVLHAQISNVPETNTRLQRKYLGRFSPLERVTAENFYDFVVVVVKKFQSPYGFLELYVTDYTENSQFRQYEKPADGYSEDWPGPLGKFTLRIDVMAPHAGWVYQNVREDEIVFLTNVRIKTNRNGDGGLEGNIFPDRVYPNRIQVREARENDPGLEELLGRQRLYKTRSMGAFLSGNVKDKGESKGKKKKSRNKKKQTENQPTETVQSEGTPLESKAERVMHTPERALNQTDIHGETPKRIPHKTGLAQSGKCMKQSHSAWNIADRRLSTLPTSVCSSVQLHLPRAWRSPRQSDAQETHHLHSPLHQRQTPRTPALHRLLPARPTLLRPLDDKPEELRLARVDVLPRGRRGRRQGIRNATHPHRGLGRRSRRPAWTDACRSS